MGHDRVEIYKDSKGEWRWRLLASNGQIIATSGEGYVKYSHCVHMVNQMWEYFGEADVVTLEDSDE